MSLPNSPVLVAGMPRSGSTWTFNAARLLLRENRVETHAAWIDDYERAHSAPVHLVKVHRPEQLDFEPACILTTARPFEECLASLVRMGWIRPEPGKIRAAYDNQKHLYSHWAARSDLEIAFADILERPDRVLRRLSDVLGLDFDPAWGLADQLTALQPPADGGYDRETLLHPGHRAVADDAARVTAADVAAMIRT